MLGVSVAGLEFRVELGKNKIKEKKRTNNNGPNDGALSHVS